MRKQFKEINGIEFTVKKPLHYIPLIKDFNRDLMVCYERPSSVKKAIWKSWLKWAAELPGNCQLGVSSYNCNFFTIGGLWYTEDGKEYVMYITKTRREIREVLV